MASRAVGGRADDLDALRAVEQARKALAHDRVVVAEQDSDEGAGCHGKVLLPKSHCELDVVSATFAAVLPAHGSPPTRTRGRTDGEK